MSDDVLAPLEGPASSGSARVTAELRSFLIADIRGYTSFTQRFGDERAAALAERFAVVTRPVGEHDGRSSSCGATRRCGSSPPHQHSGSGLPAGSGMT